MRAQQQEAKAVWLNELKCDIVAQLHSPLRVIGPLTLSISPPHLMVSSKSLETIALTTKIYHWGSNNISTRKLSDSVLCGLALVEFIKSSTQVAKMISADSGGIELWGLGEHQPLHSRYRLCVHGIRFMTLSTIVNLSRPSAASPGWDETQKRCSHSIMGALKWGSARILRYQAVAVSSRCSIPDSWVRCSSSSSLVNSANRPWKAQVLDCE